jgi:hypothetical protein
MLFCGKEYPDETEVCPDQQPLISESSIKTKSHWKSLGLLAFGGILLIAAFLNLPRFINPKLHKFTHRDVGYYTDFAKACDELLQNYPLGTDEFMEIAKTDPSIPEIIRDLQPQKIEITSNHIWMAVEFGRLAFGVSWSPREGMTNPWVITVKNEGGSDILFSTNR